MKTFNAAAAKIIAPALNMEVDEVEKMMIKPPKPEMGDVGFPCFTLAKVLKKAPPIIAKELCEKVAAAEPFSEIKAVGPYLNFVISTSSLIKESAAAVLADPEKWGSTNSGAGKTVVVDFSSPNIAKPLAIHHLRSTCIGAALARMYEATGWKVEKINHLGDWGTNFGQLMVSYKIAEKAGEEVGLDIDSQLKMYVKFHAECENNESLNDDARTWFKKLEDGDAEAKKFWKIFREESMKPLHSLYERMNISFDHYTGESFFNDKMDEVVKILKEKNILVKSDGAMVVDLEKDGMPPCLIIKSDGATTYATRDLAAALYRQREYAFDKCVYVVANQQELHFRQVFKTIKEMGLTNAAGCEHVKFGMLSLGPGLFGADKVTGATRKGIVIFLKDVLDRAVEEAKKIIVDNAREDEVKDNADELAEMVGTGAVMFTEFMQRRMKDIVFTWERALSLQGDSGPYLQYTHARLSSVLRKYGKELPSEIKWEKLESQLERGVLMAIAEYPAAIDRAVSENEPSIVAEYLLELCAVFNRMFADKENHRIITDDEELSAARAALVDAVRKTLSGGLALLGLGAPERM